MVGCTLFGVVETVFYTLIGGLVKQILPFVNLTNGWFARAVVLHGWAVYFAGIQQLYYEKIYMAFYALPL